MKQTLIRIVAQIGITLWLVMLGSIGISTAYYCAGLLGAIPMTLFLLIVGGFLEGTIYTAAKDEFK